MVSVAIPHLRRRFQPRPWPTLIAVIGLAILLALGAWQLDRLAWKTDLLDRIAERLEAPVVPLPAMITDPPAWDYARVSVTGRFVGDRALPLLGRIHQVRPGAHMLTPFARSLGPEGGDRPAPILVNRGWVPLETIHQYSRLEGDLATGDPITMSGVLRLPSGPGWVTPANDPDANEWFWIDIPEMARVADLGTVMPLILIPDPPLASGAAFGPDGVSPVPVEVRVTIPNNHLKYALTWFGLAAVLMAVYVISQTRKAPR